MALVNFFLVPYVRYCTPVILIVHAVLGNHQAGLYLVAVVEKSDSDCRLVAELSDLSDCRLVAECMVCWG